MPAVGPAEVTEEAVIFDSILADMLFHSEDSMWIPVTVLPESPVILKIVFLATVLFVEAASWIPVETESVSPAMVNMVFAEIELLVELERYMPEAELPPVMLKILFSESKSFADEER